MPHDDSDALAEIEAGLSESDPAFDRRFTESEARLRRRSPPWATWLPRWGRRQAEVGAQPRRLPSLHRRQSAKHADKTPPVDARHAVVVGCDGTPASDGALRFAAKESVLRAARLIVLATYYQPIDPDLDEYDTPEAVLQSRAHASAHRALCRALDLTRPVLPPHEIVIERGGPARVLLAAFGEADLIVVGSHQRHLASRLLHGPSTSANLIHHGQVPVVVVPPDWDARAPRTAGEG